jgi:hypothetical protein
MDLITEAVKSAAELQQQLGSKRQNRQRRRRSGSGRSWHVVAAGVGAGWMAGEITRHCIPETFSTGKRLAHT